MTAPSRKFSVWIDGEFKVGVQDDSPEGFAWARDMRTGRKVRIEWHEVEPLSVLATNSHSRLVCDVGFNLHHFHDAACYRPIL